MAAMVLLLIHGLLGRAALVPVAPVAMLPNGWVLSPPRGPVVRTGTMPQGMALSPNGDLIAVVESGYNPAALALYRLPGLAHVATIVLPGALGRPIWLDSKRLLVPGANADALLEVDIDTKNVRRIAFSKGSYPTFVAVARDQSTYAVACDGDGTIRLGALDEIGHSRPIAIGGHPGGLAFSADGKRLFATVRSSSEMYVIDTVKRRATHQRVGLHPSAVAVHGDKLYVALTDGDAVAVYDAREVRWITTLSLRDTEPPRAVIGVSPNAIFIAGETVFVTLGAANSVAVIRGGRLVGRVQAGWYPTDVAEAGDHLYVLDGKGEGAQANPRYRPAQRDDSDYIGAIEDGSLRAYDATTALKAGGDPQGSVGWNAARSDSVVRRGGPIKHVFFVLKENRSYDQVLGDVPEGNGDATLAWFGGKVTPNEHAIAARFGLFDNAYTSGEVSDSGHMWVDAGFANDYVERFWPLTYGGRRVVDDLSAGDGARVPAGGYLWESARRAHVSFRDYGELVDRSSISTRSWNADVASLRGLIDPHYAGWDLHYSDLAREQEWRREFEDYVRAGTLPQFELIWLPSDHTYGSKIGELTPASYVATNDDAVGQMVDTLSHSKAWATSVMFVIEDDAQDGPDHVSDQRTTLFVVSPYSRGGLRHEHYATVSVLRTIEILLDMQPLSTYDAMAVPMFSAFTPVPNLHPYHAIGPEVSLAQRNARTAYGSLVSARLNFSGPDAAPDAVLDDILAHNHERS
jgi:DNA-binding beta-propeller fold protein YncE